VLGLRLVKKSVNQDDVSAYHLFYADGNATPGTDLTFFDWPVQRERRGTHSIVRTGLRVDSEATLQWWSKRFAELDVVYYRIQERDGRNVLDFEDFEGQRLSLIEDKPNGEVHPWEKSPVPAEHQIRGLGPITISVAQLLPTDRVLTTVMNMRRAREYKLTGVNAASVQVYEMGEGSPSAELHVAVEPALPGARQGAGGAHHVAFRTPNEETYKAWQARLTQFDISSSGPVDRYYFQSLYFREPNGVLFEIATDGPGFAVDEPLDMLGERLALPPFLEPNRKEIEAGLKPLVS
jgi:glyoxalase family protein